MKEHNLSYNSHEIILTNLVDIVRTVGSHNNTLADRMWEPGRKLYNFPVELGYVQSEKCLKCEQFLLHGWGQHNMFAAIM